MGKSGFRLKHLGSRDCVVNHYAILPFENGLLNSVLSDSRTYALYCSTSICRHAQTESKLHMSHALVQSRDFPLSVALCSSNNLFSLSVDEQKSYLVAFGNGNDNEEESIVSVLFA